jgi:hypothetical protein
MQYLSALAFDEVICMANRAIILLETMIPGIITRLKVVNNNLSNYANRDLSVCAISGRVNLLNVFSSIFE